MSEHPREEDPSGIARTHSRRLRVAGACGGAVALAVLWAFSGAVSGVPFLPVEIAQALLRATPGDIATFFIEAMGHWAMRLLTIGTMLVALLATVEVMRLASRERPRPDLGAAFLGVATFALSLVVRFPERDPVATAFACAAAAVCYRFVAAAVYRSLLPDEERFDKGRRRVLRLGVGGATGLALAGGIVGWAARRLAGPNTDVPLVAPGTGAEIPTRADFPDVTGISPEITSVDDHYVVDINIFKPSIEVEDWSLEVGGLVDNPMTLAFDELQNRFEIVEEYSVLTCISNEVGGPLIGNSAWGGVRLRDVLDEAGVQDGADDVVFRSAEGYSDSIEIAGALDPHVLLAVSQNGEPLTQDHGFPCRLRVPPIYGMKNVKWLTSIEVVGNNYEGYWQRRGWSDDATVRTQSRIDVAGDDDGASVGTATWIAGVAWAGERGISKVEVSTDDGASWSEAEVREPVADNAWRQWAYRWTPTSSGSTRLACRATDGTGETQTARTADPHPAGATGYHFVDIDVH